MLSLENDWVVADNMQIRIVEYKKMDFYGPFLTFCLQKRKNGIVAIPISYRMETAEVSESDFALLCEAAQELYNEFGKFVLRTMFFDVTIDSAEKAEECLLEKLKGIKLFQ